MIVHFLTDVLDACQNAGVHIVATVTWVPAMSRPRNS
jgi:hypothetical protein